MLDLRTQDDPSGTSRVAISLLLCFGLAGAVGAVTALLLGADVSCGARVGCFWGVLPWSGLAGLSVVATVRRWARDLTG